MDSKILPALTNADVRRFRSKVNITGKCWIWQAALDKDGFGVFSIKSTNVRSHRLAYKIHYNIDPVNKQVLHRCGNHACVRHDHLYLTTQEERLVKVRSKRKIGPRKRRSDITPPNKVNDVLLLLASGEKQKDIAISLNISQPIVSRIKRAKYNATNQNASD